MTEITGNTLLNCVMHGYKKALSVTDRIVEADSRRIHQGRRKRSAAASLLSSKFVYEVMSAVHGLFYVEQGHCCRVIKVCDDGRKSPGEWFVDGCVTEDHENQEDFIKRILFAMESESNTSKKAFDEDFAKLVHLKAQHKLYMNGVNQTTLSGVEDYIKRRVSYAESVICRSCIEGKLFLGFWPSSAKIEVKSDGQEKRTYLSAWQAIRSDKLTHLDAIRLWQYENGKFEEVPMK